MRIRKSKCPGLLVRRRNMKRKKKLKRKTNLNNYIILKIQLI